MAVPSFSGSHFVYFLWPGGCIHLGRSLLLLSFAVGFSPDTTGGSSPLLLCEVVALVSYWLLQWQIHMLIAVLSWIAYGWIKCEYHKCPVLSWTVGGCLPSSPASHQKNAGERWGLVGKEGAFLVLWFPHRSVLELIFTFHESAVL